MGASEISLRFKPSSTSFLMESWQGKIGKKERKLQKNIDIRKIHNHSYGLENILFVFRAKYKSKNEASVEKDLKPFSPFCSPLKSTALNMSNLTSLPLSMSYKSSVDSLYSPAKSSVSKTPSTASNTSSALSSSVRFKPTSLLLKPKASATSTGIMIN